MDEKLVARLQPEAMLEAIQDLAARWHRYKNRYDDLRSWDDNYQFGYVDAKMHAYCKSIAVIMGLDYAEVLESLKSGRL